MVTDGDGITVRYPRGMQVTAQALSDATVLQVQPDDDGPYDLPRPLVLALTGAAEAQVAAVQHLRDTGQLEPGGDIDTAWPAP